jgi:hypothetical protein
VGRVLRGEGTRVEYGSKDPGVGGVVVGFWARDEVAEAMWVD